MTRRLPLATLASVLTATAVAAQNPGTRPRAIPLPDILGATFAVTDTLTGRSGPADYDFLVGTWRFTFQARQRGGSFTPPFDSIPAAADRDPHVASSKGRDLGTRSQRPST